MVATLDSKARNYRIGFTTGITGDGRFEDYGPRPERLSVNGVIREYYDLARMFAYTYYSVALWRGDEVVARGTDIRYLIEEFRYEQWKKGDRR